MGDTKPTNNPEEIVKPDVPKNLRRLKPNELVNVGDFVAYPGNVFELWEGPPGFWAESFIRPIYRKIATRLTADNK